MLTGCATSRPIYAKSGLPDARLGTHCPDGGAHIGDWIVMGPKPHGVGGYVDFALASRSAPANARSDRFPIVSISRVLSYQAMEDLVVGSAAGWIYTIPGSYRYYQSQQQNKIAPIHYSGDVAVVAAMQRAAPIETYEIRKGVTQQYPFRVPDRIEIKPCFSKAWNPNSSR